MIEHPAASHAAGTVRMTSAASVMKRGKYDCHGKENKREQTQISDSSDLFNNPLFRITPKTAEVVRHNIDRLLSYWKLR